MSEPYTEEQERGIEAGEKRAWEIEDDARRERYIGGHPADFEAARCFG